MKSNYLIMVNLVKSFNLIKASTDDFKTLNILHRVFRSLGKFYA